MKTPFVIVTCLAALLCCSTACQNGHNRLDIALEGPWILYLDHDFDDHGKKTTVLIAIAPHDATAETVDKMHHHIPQISAGDGYYIRHAGVYCLMFDDRCARPGPSSLTHDGYDDAKPLAVKFHSESGKTIWNLVDANNGVALILPIPDSYSNDGIWRADFAPKFDKDGNGYSGNVPVSIGLVLHYTNGPWWFALRRCYSPATVANCAVPAPGINHTLLQNTGTLRVVMRAPDNDDACDLHVRTAYKASMKLLDSSINSDRAVIDPARRIDSTGHAHYDDPPSYHCLDYDPQGPHPRKMYVAERENQDKGMAMETAPTIHDLGKQIENILDAVRSLDQYGGEKQKSEIEGGIVDPSKAARAAAVDLDEDFPRISQLRQIGSLLHVAARNWETLRPQLQEPTLTSPKLDSKAAAASQSSTNTNNAFMQLSNLLDEADDATGTKNGSDCRAPVMMASAD